MIQCDKGENNKQDKSKEITGDEDEMFESFSEGVEDINSMLNLKEKSQEVLQEDLRKKFNIFIESFFHGKVKFIDSEIKENDDNDEHENKVNVLGICNEKLQFQSKFIEQKFTNILSNYNFNKQDEEEIIDREYSAFINEYSKKTTKLREILSLLKNEEEL